MHQWGILVAAGDINAEEVHVDWVLLPHAVQQHRHLDAVVHGDGDLLLLDDGDPHTETQEVDVSAARRQVRPGAAQSQCLWLPVLGDFSGRRPGEGVVVPAVGHVDAGGADGHPDALGPVVDGDGAKVGVEFVFPHLLGADQLTVNGQTFNRGVLTTHQICGNLLMEPCTCSAVRNQVEDVAWFGVDVEADVHVASGQVDDEVRVVIHWRRKVMFKNKQLGVVFMRTLPMVTRFGKVHSSGPFSAWLGGAVVVIWTQGGGW